MADRPQKTATRPRASRAPTFFLTYKSAEVLYASEMALSPVCTVYPLKKLHWPNSPGEFKTSTQTQNRFCVLSSSTMLCSPTLHSVVVCVCVCVNHRRKRYQVVYRGAPRERNQPYFETSATARSVYQVDWGKAVAVDTGAHPVMVIETFEHNSIVDFKAFNPSRDVGETL